MFTFCFLHGFASMFQRLVELINRYQKQVFKFNLKRNAMPGEPQLGLIQ